MPRRKIFWAIVQSMLISVIVIPGTTAHAAVEWEFDVGISTFASNWSGESGLPFFETVMERSSSNFADNPEDAFNGHIRAGKGRWSYAIEYIDSMFETDDSSRFTIDFGITEIEYERAVETTSEVSIYQAEIGYDLVQGPQSLKLIGALRETSIDVSVISSITAISGGTNRGRPFENRESEDLLDLVIGARITQDITDNLELTGYADVGAGDSDLTYQLLVGMDWLFYQGLAATVTYRMLDWDYNDNDLKWDMRVQGLSLGLRFRF